MVLTVNKVQARVSYRFLTVTINPLVGRENNIISRRKKNGERSLLHNLLDSFTSQYISLNQEAYSG